MKTTRTMGEMPRGDDRTTTTNATEGDGDDIFLVPGAMMMRRRYEERGHRMKGMGRVGR
jgi:hypothetical protein